MFLKSSARGTQLILSKLGKETSREWGEAGKNPSLLSFSFFFPPALFAARGFAARRLLLDSSANKRKAACYFIALINARNALGKERECSQSMFFIKYKLVLGKKGLVFELFAKFKIEFQIANNCNEHFLKK